MQVGRVTDESIENKGSEDLASSCGDLRARVAALHPLLPCIPALRAPLAPLARVKRVQQVQGYKRTTARGVMPGHPNPNRLVHRHCGWQGYRGHDRPCEGPTC